MGMLRLRRYQNQEIHMRTASGERIVVKLGRMKGSVVVGVDAPRTVRVWRDNAKDLTEQK